MATSIVFNSLNINSGSYIVSKINDTPMPEIDLKLFKIPNTGRTRASNKEFNALSIKISGTIIGTSASNVQTLIDTFKASFDVLSANLDVDYGGGTRRYLCAVQQCNIDQPIRGSFWAKFEIELISLEYGQDTSVTTLKNAVTINTTPSTQSLVIGGSAPEQWLRIAVTLFSGTGISGKTITLLNDTNNRTLSVTRNWSVSDVLEIDEYNMTVKVNGIEVDFDGDFLQFTHGNHDLIISNDFTTYSLRLTVDHYRRYI